MNSTLLAAALAATLLLGLVLLQPTASFIVDREDGLAPLEVHFNNTSTFAYSQLWLFGDGATSTSRAPTHTYEEPGIYIVRLVVKGLLGRVSWSEEDVVMTAIAPPPLPDKQEVVGSEG